MTAILQSSGFRLVGSSCAPAADLRKRIGTLVPLLACPGAPFRPLQAAAAPPSQRFCQAPQAGHVTPLGALTAAPIALIIFGCAVASYVVR
jgi:hypothetical protein